MRFFKLIIVLTPIYGSLPYNGNALAGDESDTQFDLWRSDGGHEVRARYVASFVDEALQNRLVMETGRRYQTIDKILIVVLKNKDGRVIKVPASRLSEDSQVRLWKLQSQYKDRCDLWKSDQGTEIHATLLTDVSRGIPFQIALRKEDGTKITVPVDRLAFECQDRLRIINWKHRTTAASEVRNATATPRVSNMKPEDPILENFSFRRFGHWRCAAEGFDVYFAESRLTIGADGTQPTVKELTKSEVCRLPPKWDISSLGARDQSLLRRVLENLAEVTLATFGTKAEQAKYPGGWIVILSCAPEQLLGSDKQVVEYICIRDDKPNDAEWIRAISIDGTVFTRTLLLRYVDAKLAP